ncbi:alpha/beta hydrolase-fold protein [Aridibaculum aurantiacum]|uniref:alpha/beta hydrolase-fold protein n=1 Tax=Aridibaculum aurantiacum TaxID=2810307 RepID=UPI001A9777FA|nr:alpha/beta hydrolase-fold protein [Aridibaculum aurantiacum]
MKNIFLLLLLAVMNLPAFSQYTLRLVVNEVATKKQDDIYVAGSFNNWNPKDEKYKLKPFGTSRKAIVIKELAPGKYQYKFTRGGWDKVQTTAKGEDMQNLEVDVTGDVSQNHDIDGWQDDYPERAKPNTATSQVKILDNAFAIPQLNRTRRIWVYLPKGYETSKKTYPVLYMHDGQNLFSEHTASFGEWGVDEAMDTLIARTRKEVIIVGIDNGGDKRLQEYNPYDHQEFGKGEGGQYVEFITNTLKPFIDNKYRTQRDAVGTYIAGSSMGGLISMYAIAKYPHVFGGAGIFSPAFWTAPAIYDEVKNADWQKAKPKLFFYAGGKESDQMVPDMDKMIKLIQQKGNYNIRRVMAPLGKHNEPTWRSEFPEFFTFISSN